MKEKISSLGTEEVVKMNSPALICQPVSASDNKNLPLENDRQRKRARKSKLAKEGTNIFDTFDGAKPQLLNRCKKRRSVSTLSIPRASDRGVEWVDLYFRILNKDERSFDYEGRQCAEAENSIPLLGKWSSPRFPAISFLKLRIFVDEKCIKF
jgi:hypothetical protein